MEGADLQALLDVREDPLRWFQGFGYWLDDENSRQPTNGRANILQRRVFEHYKRCLSEKKPCKVVVLKYRRAGSSTASTATLYTHALNFPARLGVIGVDYKASANMLSMVKTFGRHDRFPGWSGGSFKEGGFEVVPWDERTTKEIATKIEWPHGSTIELYTAKNPTSARSAGLQGYLATECGLWANDGEQSAIETLTAMRNTLPKKGFSVCIEESTAHGASGAFYETCKGAKWPDYATWWKQWESDWPLQEKATGPERDMQFTMVFASWFEDDRHFFPLTEKDAKHVEDTLDGDESYIGEKDLIARYGQDGPKGKRLGGEVNATVWEQLVWRRAMIEQTKGLDNFAQEYPADPLTAFKASGSPVFCQVGLTAIGQAQRIATKQPEYGYLDKQPNGRLVWRSCRRESEGMFIIWERPVPGCRYIISVDPMSGASLITGNGEKDCHAVLVLRDAYIDHQKTFYPVKVVARIKAPCRFDTKPLAKQIALLSTYYGRCSVVVETNAGIALITTLRDDCGCALYERQIWDSSRQTTQRKLGWQNDEQSRRVAVATAQDYVREQKLELMCPKVLAEMRTFVVNDKGKAEASGGNHDDDVLSLAMGLTCLPAASAYPTEAEIRKGVPDEERWVEK
jgi:hypothetical protein